MKISAVSCILGIINTLAAYSRGVPHIECVMESVYASYILQHPSLDFRLALYAQTQKQRTEWVYSSENSWQPDYAQDFWRAAHTFLRKRLRWSNGDVNFCCSKQLLTGIPCSLNLFCAAAYAT